jgi:hypothetical protein
MILRRIVLFATLLCSIIAVAQNPPVSVFGGPFFSCVNGSSTCVPNNFQIPTGFVFQIGTDTGLSRDSAGVIDVGNGTAGNKGGTINDTTENVSGTATIGTLAATTINGAALNGTFTGAGTLSGNLVFSGQPSFTQTTGTPPFAVTSTTNVANLNAALLNGATFSAPGAIGGGTASAANFTTLGLTGLETVPVGTATAPDISATGSASNTGLLLTTSAMCWDAAASITACGVTGGFQVGDGKSFGFSQNTSGNGAAGANYGVIGTGATEALAPSTVLLLPQCKVTSPVSMTSSGTPVTICSWTLPNAAQTWAWRCSGTYTTTTATDTFSLGYTAAQAPTAAKGSANIYSTLTGTSTQGSVSSTTSTANQTMLTGASVSNVTNEQWTSFGWVTASATSGTFVITGTLTGTTPSGTADAVCELF